MYMEGGANAESVLKSPDVLLNENEAVSAGGYYLWKVCFLPYG